MPEQYDAIVLGDGIGAMVAAATLGSAKKRVLWVPHERQTWSFPAGGHRFPVEDGPFVGLSMEAVFPALADATGLHLSEAGKFVPLDPPLQVLLPNLRMDLPLETEALAREALRETGAEPAETRSFVDALDRVRAATTRLLEETSRGQGGKASSFESASESVMAKAPRALTPAVKRSE